ncbi:transcriptional regulator with XRE-family HTH domain [Sphingomonas trueperi]
MQLLAHDANVSTPRLYSKRQSFIPASAAVMQTALVGTNANHDPNFGPRLAALIKAAGYRSARAFAIKGMGWPEDSGAQRLANYLNKNRVPDLPTLVGMAKALGISVQDLLGLQAATSPEGDGSRDILLHLLEIEGIDPARANTLASAFLAAQQLYRAIPEDESLEALARFSAHAAWLQHQPPEQDR